jgi:hypothetical protein
MSDFSILDFKEYEHLPAKLINVETNTKHDELPTIVLISSLAGSILEDVTDPNNIEKLWLSSKLLLYGNLGSNKIIDRLSLKYNPMTEELENKNGNRIDVPMFGSTMGCDSLMVIGNQKIWLANVMADVIEFLQKHGYKDSESLLGACYDFRLIGNPSYQIAYFKRLTDLIEKGYKRNNKPIIIISLSLGCLVSYRYLASLSQEWKDKYLKAYVPISGSYGGTPSALNGAIFGQTYSLPVDINKFSESIRDFSGLHMCFPNSTEFINPSIYAKKKISCLFCPCGGKSNDSDDEYITYDNSLESIKKIFKNKPEIAKYYEKQILKTFNYQTPPTIKTYVITGKYADTPYQYHYESLNSSPKVINEAEYYKYLLSIKSPLLENFNLDEMIGDGTVPWISLNVPRRYWKVPHVVCKSFDGNHLSVLKNKEMQDYLWTIVMS